MDARVARLRDVAHGRSGDKLDRANIGLVCGTEADFEYLRRGLPASRVADYLEPFLGAVDVTRYEVPGVLGFNFVVEHALDGGSTVSRRVDRLGKALSGLLLSMPLPDRT